MRVLGLHGKIEVSVFGRPRFGKQQTYWSTADVFKVLNMQLYDGKASKWTGMLAARWDARLSKSYGPGQVVFGPLACKSGGRKTTNAKPYYQRCLTECCLSTVGFFDLLLRWGHNSGDQGGSSEPHVREASCMLFASIVSSYFPAQNFDLYIELSAPWVCSWPRPADAVTHKYVSIAFPGMAAA